MNMIVIFSSTNTNKSKLILHFSTLFILFFFMSTIIYLIVFQTFLFYKNLTVCNYLLKYILLGEYLSWNKISYLQKFKKEMG